MAFSVLCTGRCNVFLRLHAACCRWSLSCTDKDDQVAPPEQRGLAHPHTHHSRARGGPARDLPTTSLDPMCYKDEVRGSHVYPSLHTSAMCTWLRTLWILLALVTAVAWVRRAGPVVAFHRRSLFSWCCPPRRLAAMVLVNCICSAAYSPPHGRGTQSPHCATPGLCWPLHHDDRLSCHHACGCNQTTRAKPSSEVADANMR